MITKLISNEKYMGHVLPQKSVRAGGSKIRDGGFMNRNLHSKAHETIISGETFRTTQQEELQHIKHKKCPITDALLNQQKPNDVEPTYDEVVQICTTTVTIRLPVGLARLNIG